MMEREAGLMGHGRQPARAGEGLEPTMFGTAGPAAGERRARPDPARVIAAVYDALAERGYDPVRQLAGYLLSGDPAYITSHRGARALVGRVQRDELLAELVRAYVAGLRARQAGRGS